MVHEGFFTFIRRSLLWGSIYFCIFSFSFVSEYSQHKLTIYFIRVKKEVFTDVFRTTYDFQIHKGSSHSIEVKQTCASEVTLNIEFMVCNFYI